jgi:hypothetical protein
VLLGSSSREPYKGTVDKYEYKEVGSHWDEYEEILSAGI